MNKGSVDTAVTVAVFSGTIALLSTLVFLTKLLAMFVNWEVTNRDLRAILASLVLTFIFTVICKIAVAKAGD